MRTKEKPRQVTHPITNLTVWSPYPTTREKAWEEDISKYWPMTPCPIHGEAPVYFTITDLAACCANHKALEAYREAYNSGEPCSMHAAEVQGTSYYWKTPYPNPLCGHPSKVTLAGKCIFCADSKANRPRQVAIRNGESWYMPLPHDPCANGHVALRRVNNGACKQCEDEARQQAQQGKEPEEVPINKMCPDMVVSRKDARSMGFKVYRTGEPCIKGHTGWRYVSTGACMVCLGRG